MLNKDRFSTINLASLPAILAGVKLTSARARKVICGLFILLSVIVLLLIVRIALQPAPVFVTDSLISSARSPAPKWNWFHKVRDAAVEVEDEEEPVDDEDLADASIRAELLGVLIAGEDSYAAISTSRDPKGLYGVGDEIENNVTLEKIEKDRVIISQRGARRQIRLKPLNEKANQESLIKVEGRAQPPASSANTDSGFNLSGLVSTTPVRLPEGGIGFKLGGLSSDLTDLADIREDDVVASVNGTSIDRKSVV